MSSVLNLKVLPDMGIVWKLAIWWRIPSLKFGFGYGFHAVINGLNTGFHDGAWDIPLLFFYVRHKLMSIPSSSWPLVNNIQLLHCLHTAMKEVRPTEARILKYTGTMLHLWLQRTTNISLNSAATLRIICVLIL